MNNLNNKLHAKLRILYNALQLQLKLLFIFCFFSLQSSFANELIIKGNKFSDDEVITSLIGEIPNLDNKSKSDYILKQLTKSGLFKSVEVSYQNENFLLTVLEFPVINKIYYENNKRLKDDDLDKILLEFNIKTESDVKINEFIDELKNIYRSFGYNNIQIDKKIEKISENSSNLFLEFKEGKITKVKNINFVGNQNYNKSTLLSKIKTKTKTFTNIFANNNFKLFQINNDAIRLKRFYDSEGYINSLVEFNIEYFEDNKVIVNFQINEGNKYKLSSIEIENTFQNNNKIKNDINKLLNQSQFSANSFFSRDKTDKLELEISNILELNGEQFFEIKIYEKLSSQKVDLLVKILPSEPEYVNQINILGNTRTFDYVIRREIDISEGDPINETKIKNINKKLNQLSIFEKIEVSKNDNDDLDIFVEETQTGSFNVGLSIGTLDGASFVSGLNERNINGTGRSVEFLLNTSENNRALNLSTTEKFFLNNNIDHKYSTNYSENDFSKSKSYKLNSFSINTELSYQLADNFYHSFGTGYQLKDYIITNSSTVSDSISKSSGESISFNFINDLIYNNLNSFIRPSEGNYFKFSNIIETPSSSTNGYLKNIITAKKYQEIKNDIYSAQIKLGNIYSINDSEVLSDNKFSLGGRWLRGFDNFGAGPRNSRTAYIGGNNIIVTKFDYSKPINLNDQNPIYFNIFNDYGIVWGNKNTATNDDESLRSSYGFGLNYYSPIGPIGFSWGFPLLDEDYDIKRMFMFTIGNLN